MLLVYETCLQCAPYQVHSGPSPPQIKILGIVRPREMWKLVSYSVEMVSYSNYLRKTLTYALKDTKLSTFEYFYMKNSPKADEFRTTPRRIYKMADYPLAALTCLKGGVAYARNPPNILWGGQISLNPYFSRGFTHIYILK